MKLPVQDYVALGLWAPMFFGRWINRKCFGRSVAHEERHNQMLNYAMLMGYDYDGFNINIYDDERTNHVFWCGNWPYAYGDYSQVWDSYDGVRIQRFGTPSASLRNVMLCRQMERAKWATKHTTGPSPSHTVRGVLTGWALYWAGWLRSILSSKIK